MQLKVWTKYKNSHKIKYYVNELYIGYKGLFRTYEGCVVFYAIYYYIVI